jgi:hypothetical protein
VAVNGICGELVVGIVGLVAMLAAVIALTRAERRRHARRAAVVAELAIGVSFFAPGADRPTRVVLSVEHLGPAQVAVVLQPIDGTPEASIVLPRSTAGDTLPALLAARASLNPG